MTNREWLNSLSDEKLAEKLLPPTHCECGDCIIHAECTHIWGNCYDRIVEWLKRKHKESMPELQVGDIIVVLLDKGLINKIVVGLIVMSDKYASNINGVMYNLEDLNIRTIKRMNNTNERVEIIWRADK